MFQRPLKVSCAISNINSLIGLATDREKAEFIAVLNNTYYDRNRDTLAENGFLLHLEEQLLKRAQRVSCRNG